MLERGENLEKDLLGASLFQRIFPDQTIAIHLDSTIGQLMEFPLVSRRAWLHELPRLPIVQSLSYSISKKGTQRAGLVGRRQAESVLWHCLECAGIWTTGWLDCPEETICIHLGPRPTPTECSKL